MRAPNLAYFLNINGLFEQEVNGEFPELVDSSETMVKVYKEGVDQLELNLKNVFCISKIEKAVTKDKMMTEVHYRYIDLDWLNTLFPN